MTLSDYNSVTGHFKCVTHPVINDPVWLQLCHWSCQTIILPLCRSFTDAVGLLWPLWGALLQTCRPQPCHGQGHPISPADGGVADWQRVAGTGGNCLYLLSLCDNYPVQGCFLLFPGASSIHTSCHWWQQSTNQSVRRRPPQEGMALSMLQQGPKLQNGSRTKKSWLAEVE